ncbi:MAG: CoA-binding protein [Nanoarchaeota archaeon]|nr:CoA-binding protein [Nanoarchaeota archaeon]
MKNFFEPRRIAVIGASRFKGKVGHDIFKNLLKEKKKVYPVNPNAKKILGRKAYTSILDIKEKIDLAIIAVPARIVPIVLEECGKKKVQNVIIISSGFSEVGNNELEEKIKLIGKKYNIKILGPNCLGIINPHKKLNAAFFNKMPPKGAIAFISQSGALGVAVLDWAIQNKVGLSAFVSIGNASDIKFPELIDYFSKDKHTKAICLYVEGLKDGKKFMSAVLRTQKPVIVLKGGLTESGEKAAATHTAALTTEAGVYKGALKQCGAIQVDNLHQLFEVARHFVYGKAPKGKNGLIITNAGGAGVLASDAFDKNGLNLVDIPEKVLEKLNKVLPIHWSKRNPIDVIGDATPKRYKEVLKILEKERFYDFVFFALTPQTMTEPEEVAKLLVKFHKKTKIPVFGCFMGGDAIRKAKKTLKENGILNFKEPSYGVEVISKMVR